MKIKLKTMWDKKMKTFAIKPLYVTVTDHKIKLIEWYHLVTNFPHFSEVIKRGFTSLSQWGNLKNS